jgi:predicted phosphate transport protein (TIGR00153 family)
VGAASPSWRRDTLAYVRFRLVPQTKEFFQLFSAASANCIAIAEALVELLTAFPAGSEAGIARIKELEHQGDRLTHQVIGLLNRTFVTPFDRDDIYRLATVLDDVCDHIDEAADKLGLYGVVSVPDVARSQADVILRAAHELDAAIRQLEGFRDATTQLIELRSLEDEGDRLVRGGIADLFRSGADPIDVIRWKDIHERLEEAVDAVENAADVLEAIVVKNR